MMMRDLTGSRIARRWRTIAVGTLVAALAVGTLLLIPALALEKERFTMLFGEGGPVETASLWGWVALSAMCLLTLRPTSLVSLAGCVLSLAAAAREADWHKSFTGYSVMKIGYYFDAEHGLDARALAFIVMALVIASAVIVVRAIIERWRETEQDPPDWGVVAVIAVGWLAATKVADRFRDVVGDLTGIEFSETAKTILSSWEEGGELLLPPLFGTAVWLYVRRPTPHPGTERTAHKEQASPRRRQARPKGRA